MTVLYSQSRKITWVIAVMILMILTSGTVFSDESRVSIYRDYDDGLFGRSLYRGVVFSVKLTSFDRYRTLQVKNLDGLTAYLVSRERAEDLAAGRGYDVARVGLTSGSTPESWLYSYQKNGISITFSLEKAPSDLYEEIRRTYPGDDTESLAVFEEVSNLYRDGFVLRIYEAENVYRPQFASLDYEDILISAALLGDAFQPLWGIHDGNDITASQESF